MAEKTPFEAAYDKGYLGADPAPSAVAETREADQTQGGPVVTDADRAPQSAERTDTTDAGDPVDPDAVSATRAPAVKQAARKQH